MMPSWPTIALRTSPPMASQVSFTSCRPIKKFLFPSQEFPNIGKLPRQIPGHGIVDLVDERADTGGGTALPAQLIEPEDQRSARQAARRVQCLGCVLKIDQGIAPQQG